MVQIIHYTSYSFDDINIFCLNKNRTRNSIFRELIPNQRITEEGRKRSVLKRTTDNMKRSSNKVISCVKKRISPLLLLLPLTTSMILGHWMPVSGFSLHKSTRDHFDIEKKSENRTDNPIKQRTHYFGTC